MAGLFGFWGKKKDVNEQAALQNNDQSQAFFLDSDDAKTLGNIEYMKTAKIIKRTFPKTAGSKSVYETVVQVSAMGMTSGELAAAVETAEAIANAADSAATNGALPKVDNGSSERRRDDSGSGMDMFRNMAREIRKR